jgi:hypothetical protein
MLSGVEWGNGGFYLAEVVCGFLVEKKSHLPASDV